MHPHLLIGPHNLESIGKGKIVGQGEIVEKEKKKRRGPRGLGQDRYLKLQSKRSQRYKTPPNGH
jgi:hypothetical protein